MTHRGGEWKGVLNIKNILNISVFKKGVFSIKWGVETAYHNWTHGTDRPGPEFWRYCATQEYGQHD